MVSKKNFWRNKWKCIYGLSCINTLERKSEIGMGRLFFYQKNVRGTIVHSHTLLTISLEEPGEIFIDVLHIRS